jgi:hypothetical protein
MSKRSIFLQFLNIHLTEGPQLYKQRCMWYSNVLIEFLQIEISSSQRFGRHMDLLTTTFFFLYIWHWQAATLSS